MGRAIADRVATRARACNVDLPEDVTRLIVGAVVREEEMERRRAHFALVLRELVDVCVWYRIVGPLGWISEEEEEEEEGEEEEGEEEQESVATRIQNALHAVKSKYHLTS